MLIVPEGQEKTRL